MSQFEFTRGQWPSVFEAAERAENSVYADPRTACFYARRTLELALQWAYKHDAGLRLPYQDNLSALVHEPTFKQIAGEAVFNKARVIVTLGNRAVHSHRSIPEGDALVAVRELFQVCYWLVRTYGRGGKSPSEGAEGTEGTEGTSPPARGDRTDKPPGSRGPDGQAPRLIRKTEGTSPPARNEDRGDKPGSRGFDVSALPRPASGVTLTTEQLRKIESELHARDEKLAELLADKNALDEELKQLRTEVAAARAAAAEQPDTHDYSEAETRDYFIDLLLKEAGWPLEEPRDREYEVAGMPNNQEKGYVDYVLWGDDGKPLAVVEAKRTKRDSRVGQQQAKLYADCLEKKFGQRPVIFCSNGYEHWIWDDVNYPPRAVQGFYKKDELELLIQRRATRKSLGEAEINGQIVERYYQRRAIRRIGESLEKDHDRKALLVMATGAGKTRTVIALCDLLQRCNWAKRVLFLADRVALVNQAVNAFKAFLPDSSPVNLVTEKYEEGRVFASTYPTMMGLINESKEGARRFGVGHFDLVIIDEAHRSVFQKYRTIFDYFDSLLVGLTATPKDEIDRNTYGLFDLENGVPTDSYSLDEAVRDGFLVPSQAVSVPLKFQREGIKYDDLSDEEKDAWDALEWDDDGNVPNQVEAAAVNKWLFNQDTVDKVLEHLMTRGQTVAGGDRLGKTILFAKNQDHAEYIAERFNANYPHYKGEFARVITFKTEYAQSLIDAFSEKEKAPHIAISVDMLDTGIDVPEVVNLVFFKIVRSKTKFWQMVGRGTRLCKDLFEPGKDKQFFYIFDYCQNLEYFGQNPEATDGSAGESLSKRLFDARLELIGVLDNRTLTAGASAHDSKSVSPNAEGPSPSPSPPSIQSSGRGGGREPTNESEVRQAVAEWLHRETAAMNLDNFVVRPQRRLVEKYAVREAWDELSAEALAELSHGLAGLPNELDAESEEAKRFDLVALKLQLALLNAEPSFARLRDQVIEIAGLLEEKDAIPMVRAQMPLIQDLQTDEWWQNVTVAMLEVMRRRVRELVKFIEKKKRQPIYTNFEDELGGETPMELPGFAGGTDEARFRAKVQMFLREHQDHVAIHKVRMNKPLTATDLVELERMLLESGVGEQEVLRQAIAESQGLGKFVRHLVGLDRGAAKEALGEFISGKTLTASQIEFINLIVNHLTQHGVMEAAQLYESPFTDYSPQGPDGLFSTEQIDELLRVIDKVNAAAA